jgi:hypothetical protein
MRIVEVTDKRSRKEFIGVAVKIYKDYNRWIRPLDKDIELVFDPDKNKYFRNGEAARWILVDEEGETLGRVAAFYSTKTMNKDNDQPTGGMGFFECIDDTRAATMLFDQCKNWLSGKGMMAMDGPINFGERNEWWGVLIDGFDIEPNYRCNYHPPYYRNLFESYGFQVYFKQLTYGRTVMEPLVDKIYEKANRIRQNPMYTFTTLDPRKMDLYTEYFREIYNKAWSRHKGVPQLTSLQAKTVMSQLKPIIDPKIMFFAFYNGIPSGFFIMIPEVNQIFKYVNGKLDLIGKLKFVWHKYRKSCRKMLGLVFGIIPEHQGKGLEGAIVMASRDLLQETYRRYDNLEMNWIGDFNPKMIHMVEQVGAVVTKTHATYRKLFDDKIPFRRYPTIE